MANILLFYSAINSTNCKLRYFKTLPCPYIKNSVCLQSLLCIIIVWRTAFHLCSCSSIKSSIVNFDFGYSFYLRVDRWGYSKKDSNLVIFLTLLSSHVVNVCDYFTSCYATKTSPRQLQLTCIFVHSTRKE